MVLNTIPAVVSASLGFFFFFTREKNFCNLKLLCFLQPQLLVRHRPVEIWKCCSPFSLPLACTDFLTFFSALCHGVSLIPIPPIAASRETAPSCRGFSTPPLSPCWLHFPTKPWLPLKKILQQRVNFILATKTTSVGGGRGKRDWSLAVPFHRLGALWQSENISCIRNQHTHWLQGWGEQERICTGSVL